MKLFKRIHTYLFFEFIPPFAISTFFLTSVFLMTRIPDITNMVVNYNASIMDIFLLISYTLPRFMEFTIPMSAMVSVLLTVMRMSGENEIIALKGAGMSLYKLLPPVLLFTMITFLITMWVTVYGIPKGKLALKVKTIELARSSIDAALQERQFNSQLDGIMIYVAHVDMNTRDLTDVFIEDRRTADMVSISTAPRGRLVRQENRDVYTIRLYDGMINQVNVQDHSVTSINFGHYDINIDLAGMQRSQTKEVRKDFDEMSLHELVQRIRKGFKNSEMDSEARLVLHEKFSIPFACLALGVLAFPLGVQSSSLRKSNGLGMGIGFFLLYYLLLAFGWSGGEAGRYPPVIGMWLPNVVMGGAGIFLLIRNAKERPVHLPLWIQHIPAAVMGRFRKGTTKS
ncbi:LPS export ABC transporter permease LptF [uncultured Desulfobacter sp.]|uniref:LPS export ABC transporter permease LptF n=1 Tax=uncultured Desulfobacter sp. TaxID=240139 RepID=UPI0029F573D6|nr:LPS export ABC transporter permease LptF [uncultured Desulfobacter sp.]